MATEHLEASVPTVVEGPSQYLDEYTEAHTVERTERTTRYPAYTFEDEPAECGNFHDHGPHNYQRYESGVDTSLWFCEGTYDPSELGGES